MNKVIINYILKNFLKNLLIIVLVFYSFGLILNLFEEIEFFKNSEVSIFVPLMLTSIFIPSMITKLFPFIIFISSLWFIRKIRNNKDLLTLKIYGYSNIKIFFILAFTSFIIGWIILLVGNPMTSSMVKYYEKTKSKYARDIDHLVTFNRNGLWIKENTNNGSKIITAKKPDGFYLIDVTIFHLNSKYDLVKKISSKKVNIENNEWVLENVTIFKPINGILNKENLKEYRFNSIYNHEKINSLFKNFDTMSFLDLVFNYQNLLENGYNKDFLNQSLHTMLSLPFFLFLMTGIASILTLNTLKKSDNFKFIIIGLLVTVLVFYFKDLSLALGQTDRIPLILAIWAPVIALSFFTFVGVLQINEK
jgi:lipopolysaccharide export system permease protein